MRDGHSSGTPVTRCLKQPTRAADPDRSGPSEEEPAPPLFGLAPGGVCRAGPVAGPAVRSYRTVSPLPPPFLPPRHAGWVGGAGGLFSVALSLGRFRFRGDWPAGRYPAPLVHGARTFLHGHLSVLAAAAVRPTDMSAMGSDRGFVKVRRIRPGYPRATRRCRQRTHAASRRPWRASAASTGRPCRRSCRAGSAAGTQQPCLGWRYCSRP